MAKSADYNLGEYDFPRGWFAVANSSEITKTPVSARYFEQDVVIFRGESGRAVMLQAYCPHMGTHLAKSRTAYIIESGRHVEQDSIRCPFHGWRFGPDGRCNDIPYFDGPIPKHARLRSWPVEERYGVVFCWNDPEGQEPDFGLPDFPEWDDPQFMRWTGLEHLADLPCHPIEIFDNNSDYAHLMYTHGSAIKSYENEADGHCYRQRQSLVGLAQSIGDSFGDERRVSTVNAYHGPGLNAARFIEANAAQLIAVTPIENGSARLWQCAMIRRPEGVSEAQAQEILVNFNRNMAQGLGEDDGEIWANKRAAVQIMQLPTDGPFRQARVWYSQFFNPRAKAAEILDRVKGLHYVRGVPAFSETPAGS